MTGKPYEDTPRTFSRWQRFLIVLATYVGYPLVYLIGRSLRWTVIGWEHWQPLEKAGVPTIFVFWHNGLMPAAWYFRGRGVVVMITQNFDGEYIARIIKRLGYAAARGSSSRGGMKALHEMAHHLHQGRHVAFPVDGPRGPRYVAKIGPVLLAQRTGRPIVCVHVSPKRRIRLSSWDHFRIPLPFTRVVLRLAPPIYMPRNAARAQVLAVHADMQRQLDQQREEAENDWRPAKKATLEND